ncbi:uncharacterized protein LOC128951321 [Oppia nitens]|uniref:uncharacterized protein LOC128951321 n=1 Tax=Oppia nitens TaxID=1686743 RepID=UPI0023DB24F8|nr:uncharacterized protein LOC128951321 [Oppia nitens]
MTSTAPTHITIYWDRESCPPPITSRHIDSTVIIRKLLTKVCVTERRLRLKHLVSWSSVDITGVDIYYDNDYYYDDNLDHLLIDNYNKYAYFSSYTFESLSDSKTALVVISGDRELLQLIKTLDLDNWVQLSIIYADLVDISELGFSDRIKRLPFDQLVKFCNEYEKINEYCLSSAITGLIDLMADLNFNETSSSNTSHIQINITETNSSETNRDKYFNWWTHINWLMRYISRWFYLRDTLGDSQQQHDVQPEQPQCRQSDTHQEMRNKVTNKSVKKQYDSDGQLSVNSMTKQYRPTSTSTAAAGTTTVTYSDDKKFSDRSSSDSDQKTGPTPGTSGQSLHSMSLQTASASSSCQSLTSNCWPEPDLSYAAINSKKTYNNKQQQNITGNYKKKKNQIDDHFVGIDKRTDNTSGYRKKTYESGVCGLRNLGNTCYMNSALQCLSNIPSMVEFCKEYKNFKIGITNTTQRSLLLELFCELIDRMWSQQTDCLSPKEFRSKVAEVLPTFVDHKQHDCSEFLRSVLNTFHEELLQMSGIVNNSFTDDYKTFDQYLQNNHTFISNHFHGLQVVTFSCSRCGHRLDDNYCPFVVINLPQIDKEDITLIHVNLIINSNDCETFRWDIYGLRFTTNEVQVSQLIKTLSQRYSDTTTSRVLDAKHLIVALIINHKIDKIYNTNDIINANCLSGHLFVYQFDPSFVNHVFVSLQSKSRQFGIPLLLDINEYTFECIVDQFVVQFMKCLAPEGRQLLICLSSDFSFHCDNHFNPNLTIGNNLIINELSEHLCQFYSIDKFYHGLDDKNLDKNIKLDDCINRYVSVQRMDDQQNCPNCCTDMLATVETHIMHAPNILLLQVKNSIGQQRGSYFRYDSQPDCQFPMELDLTGHVSDAKANGAQHVYDLLAISNYTGNSCSGHYTAYAKNHINKQWYEFNDNNVKQITDEQQLHSSKAYLMFYLKQNINNN